MDDPTLPLPLLLVTGIGSFGIYMMLPLGQPAVERRMRQIGGSLALFSICALAILVGSREEWWPQDGPLSVPSGAVFFWGLAGAAVLSGAMTITAHKPTQSVTWFGLLLAANSGLLAIQGAQYLALATLLFSAGVLSVVWLFAAQWAQHDAASAREPRSYEPFLACATGTLFAAVLISSIHYALTTEASRSLEAQTALVAVRRGQTSFPLLRKLGPATGSESPVESLGVALFQDRSITVGLTAVLLFVGLVAAVVTVRGHQGTQQESLDARTTDGNEQPTASSADSPT